MKICIVSSAGGHLTQLLLLEEVWRKRDHFFVTVRKYAVDVLHEHSVVYITDWANRRNPVKLVKVTVQCLRILLTERPDVVLSTGAALGCVMCILGKLLGAKIVWVDTISHVDTLTLSGKIVRHFADVFLVQWAELSRKYDRVLYVGSVV